MEVSNEIKEDIRKTQTDLKNAIRVHQIWVARLQEDEHNIHLKIKVKEAEKEIIAIGRSQKTVVDRLRRELILYQQRLKARNKQVSIENETRYVAQQLRDHQLQYRSRNRSISLLKPSVLNEILIKSESNDGTNASDSDNELKSFNDKENSNINENFGDENYQKNISQLSNTVNDSRNNFTNALKKVKEALIGTKVEQQWCEQRSDSDSSQDHEPSPTPSPPPLPEPGEPVPQEIFMRLLGLITHQQRELVEKKRNERRKRRKTTTANNDFIYGNYDMLPKRKKLNQFPYLQSHSDPPQTRSAKLKKQQGQAKSSREGSPSGSSTENKVPDKLAEHKRLQQRNIELCEELSKLEARAATLKENLDEHNEEKQQLLADQINTQRNLQKLLDFISQFRQTAIRIRTAPLADPPAQPAQPSDHDSNEE
ncbi:PREDICTED: uncharacterized protein LOC106100381 [Papilio polytes]|uniref:uncharacterized protein LOC106100381 n=1 Tax=Papilio polytes TaxID=76194 RepID=UPI00067695B6|nr:PREDICTED: uncharacterized protein LOC106100381 [Papilio polytes]